MKEKMYRDAENIYDLALSQQYLMKLKKVEMCALIFEFMKKLNIVEKEVFLKEIYDSTIHLRGFTK